MYITTTAHLPIPEDSQNKDLVKYYVFTPEDVPSPRGIVQILHGMCEYVLRYDRLIAALTDIGFICCGIDMRGHGRTGFPDVDIRDIPPSSPLDETAEMRKRRLYGNLGYFGDGVNFEQLYADEDNLRLLMREKYPDLPYIFYGHSMGSLITRGYVAHYHDTLDGLILSGTVHNPSPTPQIGLTLANGVIRRYGERHISKNYRNMFFFSYIYGIEADGPVAFNSADAAIREEFLSDPLCHFNYSMSAYRELLHIVIDINNEDRHDAMPRDIPILFISGEDDPFGGRGRGVTAIVNRLVEQGHTNVTMKIYPNMRHDIVHDNGYEQVLSDVCAFVETIIAPPVAETEASHE
jgi:alpha-beta hydrolase superfamily lysophospholipase